MRTQHYYSFGLCIVFLCGTTLATADELRVDRNAEFVGPALVLPVSRQVTEASPADVDVEVSVMAAPTESEVVVEHSTELIAPPEPIVTEPIVTEPSHVVYEPMCRELPVANHIMHIGARRFARRQSMVPMTLQVSNPADCTDCCYTVCVNVPACCQGETSICDRTGLLGRGIVEYHFACGWTVKVVFRTRGDVVVHYTAG